MPTVRHRSPLLLAAMLVACGSEPTAAPKAPVPTPTAPAAGPDAKQMFESLCFTCHGLAGHGDGPGAAALNPKPRSFNDAVWQDSVTDDHIKKVIVYGGAAVGKSPMMVAQPQLKGNDAVLDGLVKIIRGFRGK